MRLGPRLVAAVLACTAGAAPAAQTAPELARLLETYGQLVDSAGNPRASLAPDVQKLLDDPEPLLVLLERRFYQQPAIESLAWYGTVAEDVAYIGMSRRTDPSTGAVSPGTPAANAWLRSARAGWRKMISHMERGWSADAPWARYGTYHYEAVPRHDVAQGAVQDRPIEVLAARWFVPVKPSLFREDRDLYAIGGEPMTKRQMLRGKAGVFYAAELSDLVQVDAADSPRSYAGGFRRVHGFVEFLKGQPERAPMKFLHASQYGVDGLLGTVGVEVGAPPSVAVYALTREGATRAASLQISSRHEHCGPAQGVRVRFEAPLKSMPLAYVASLRAFEPARTTVRALGTLQADNVPGTEAAAMPPFRYSGFRIDLDGDGQADILVVQGRGPAELPTSGTYAENDALLSAVWANIGGSWKRVASASEGGCT